MTDVYYFFVGIAVGTIFFGGLKLTIELAPRVRRPSLLWLSSYFFRTVFLLGALILMGKSSGLAALLPGIIGITVVLILSMILTQRGGKA